MKSVKLLVIAAMTAVTLSGCVDEDPTKGAPFGESDSLYLAPKNIEEFIEIAQDATVHIFCETEDEDLPYAGSGFHLEIGDDRYIITNAHVIQGCLDDAAELFVYDSEDNAHLVKLLSYRHVKDWRGQWDVAVLTGRDFGRAITIAPEDPETRSLGLGCRLAFIQWLLVSADCSWQRAWRDHKWSCN